MHIIARGSCSSRTLRLHSAEPDMEPSVHLVSSLRPGETTGSPRCQTHPNASRKNKMSTSGQKRCCSTILKRG
ncbi:hypothetical protein RRG08_025610 [Elysia crispata]|uniref:Uncharacterized protein n=1 Tax=Elysia crispata TaxID=231223 RepID=A0AAE0YEY5_9GAST|nr:hypothetical protein RRG08_025610 [Elysia crispata]